MTAHAPLQPSSAARWIKCPGSVRLEALYPEDQQSEAAREGTAAHWALTEVCHGRAVAEGQVTPDNHVLTAEMIEGADDVLAWVHARIAEHGEAPQMFVDHRVTMPRIHPDNWGTLDLALWFAAARTLYLLDYKFGHGWVEIFENYQVIDYAEGMLAELGINGASDHQTRVVLGIAQPRSYHPDGPMRFWSVLASDLRVHWNKLTMAAMLAYQAEPPTVVNDECDNCRARRACPALQATGLRAMDRAEQAVPFDLPVHALGIELHQVRKALKALTARETGLAGQVEATIARGEAVPFWSLAREPGRMKWKTTTAEVLALGTMLGVQLQKPAEAITPTQAKAKGLDPALLDAYAERPNGSAKLVPVEDSSARRIFGALP